MESGIERLQYIMIAFKNNYVNAKTHDASIFDKMNVTECYRKIRIEFYLDDRKEIYGTNNYNEVLKEIAGFKIKSVFVIV